MSSISPFDYGDYHYNYTPQKLAQESKFNSFMQQNNATYFEASDEVFNNENLSGEELEWYTYHNLKESPNPNVHVISGYGENQSVATNPIEHLEVKPVDLGLSVLWADKPITDKLGFPLYFKWADSEVAYNAPDILNQICWYNESSYKFYDTVTKTYTKYNSTDGLKVLEEEDDMATAVLGKPWRTPTSAECSELFLSGHTTVSLFGAYPKKCIIKPNSAWNAKLKTHVTYMQHNMASNGTISGFGQELYIWANTCTNDKYASCFRYGENVKRQDAILKYEGALVIAVQDKN